MMSNKKPTVQFAPGCFDNFEGTEEELAELVAEIHRLVESGEIFEKARPIEDDEYERLFGNTEPRRVQ